VGNLIGFQSTRLREARLDIRKAIKSALSFNPRACVRRDLDLGGLKTFMSSFNPRACVRRDGIEDIMHGIHRGFNPRACVRRDRKIYTFDEDYIVSIHAPA